ncbi:MAG: hypothetical protein MUP85_06215 [Candidatus Lokiarchaeota archaeon]|nr:hypothetical protein [Candidatus Lokiarchaeota archaeon]
MKYYIICKICGLSHENGEPGIYFCPQCEEEVRFYKLELFDGSKPGDLYDSEK